MELTAEQYETYLRMMGEGITKKEIAIKLKAEGSRPAEVLSRAVKKFEAKLEAQKITPEIEFEEASVYTTHESVSHEKYDLEPVQKFFANSDNLKILMEMVEERKGCSAPHTTVYALPQKYAGISNTQKSIRCNPNLYQDFEKAMRKNKDLKHLNASQLLNLALYWAIEKVENIK